MAIQTPQFQPATRPVDTVATPGREAMAPAPVRAPSAPEPIMEQSSIPAPPKPYDDTFLRSLQAFGSSLGMAGNALQDERVRATEAAAVAASADMASDDLGVAEEKTRRVLEGHNRTLIDGQMQAFGSILANKLQGQVAGKPAAEAAAFIRDRTKQLRAEFKNEKFDKAFGPAAAQLVSHYQNQAAIDENKQLREQYMNVLVTEAVEFRGSRFAELEGEQLQTVVNSYLDEKIEKAVKSGVLDKNDADTFYWSLAEIAVSKGDEDLTTAIMNKPRGDQPAFAKFHKDAPIFIKKAQDRAQELNGAQTLQDTVRFSRAAQMGTFGQQPEFKGLSNEQIVTQLGERGFPAEKITGWIASSDATNELMFRRKHLDYYQSKLTAVDKGDMSGTPSAHSELDNKLFGGAVGIAELQLKAKANLEGSWRKEEASIHEAKKDEARVADAQSLALDSPANFVAAQDTVAIVDGKPVPFKAALRQEAAMVEIKSQIERSSPTPEVAADRYMDAMIERNYVSKHVSDPVRNGISISAAQLAIQDPEKARAALSLPLLGLSTFRAFEKKVALGPLRQAVGSDEAIGFFTAVNVISKNRHGGDDVAALKEVGTAFNQDPNDATNDLSSLSKDSRLEIIRQYGTSEMSGTGSLRDTSAFNNLVDKLAPVMVRAGLKTEEAYAEAAKFIGKSYGVYEGMLVPKGTDPTYMEVQEPFMKKFAAANPEVGYDADDLVLVPSIAASTQGNSGLHALRVKATGWPVTGPFKPVTFETREGKSITIHNPLNISIDDVRAIKDAVNYETEKAAILEREAKPKGLALSTEPPLRFKVGGDSNRDTGFVDHLNNEGAIGTTNPRSLHYALTYFTKSGGDAQRGLATILANKIQKAGDDKFTFIPQANLRDGVDGVTMKQNGKIAVGLHTNALNGETAIHEGIHAVVWHFMDKFENMERGSDNNVSMNNDWSAVEKEGAQKVYSVYEKVKEAKFDGPAPVWFKQAQKDPDEFLARTLTDANFQQWLRSQKSEPQKSLWNRFVDGVKSMVLSNANATEAERSLFEDAMEAGTGLLEKLE